jgi:hypothetical protein
MAQEDRDPTGCSLIFFALGKKKVVHGLWKQAPGHKEQNMMLKFLGNDFTQDRWKTAALKNAYALLSKNRYGGPGSSNGRVVKLMRHRVRCVVFHVGGSTERRYQCLFTTIGRLAIGSSSS